MQISLKITFLSYLIMKCMLTNGQIFTQNPTNGSILITPQGTVGSSYTSNVTTNVALGEETLKSNTTGSWNTAIGRFALKNNNVGNQNVAIGNGALEFNNGSANTSVGDQALANNVNGAYNTGIGWRSLIFNQTGSKNSAFGESSLYNNTTGTENSAVGSNSLFSNTIGSYNSSMGYKSLFSNTIGNWNTSLGHSSLTSNIDGANNTAVGLQTLFYNSSGGQNTAIGREAMFSNTVGNYNSVLGDRALYSCKTGGGNTALGGLSGYILTSGANNTFIGYQSNATFATITNSTAIGANAIVNASNKIRIGDANITVIEGQVPWSNPSDIRLKENVIYTNRLGLQFITMLQTTSYNYISDKNKIRYDGLIAQDVEKASDLIGIPFSGLKKSDDGMYSLSYSDFVIPLINAVKELKIRVDELKNENSNLSTTLQEQNKFLEIMQKKITELSSSAKKTVIDYTEEK